MCIYIYVYLCVGVWCRNISRQWFLASLVTINMITNGNKKMFLTSSVWRDYGKPARRNEESLPVTPPLWQSGGWLLRTNRMIYLKKNAKTKSFEGPRSLAIFKKRHTYGCVYVCIYIYIYTYIYIYIHIHRQWNIPLSLIKTNPHVLVQLPGRRNEAGDELLGAVFLMLPAAIPKDGYDHPSNISHIDHMYIIYIYYKLLG